MPAGLSTASAARQFKAAMVTAARDLFADDPGKPLVSFGHPGEELPPDIVAFTRVGTDQTVATMSVSNRSREETLTLTVIISVARGGGPEVEQVCSDRAYELLEVLEFYTRVTDTTVGGTVRECFLTSTDSDGSTDPEILASGRVIEITAVFTAHARITTL